MTKPRELKLKARFEGNNFDGYDVVSGSVNMDDPEAIYYVREVVPNSCESQRTIDWEKVWKAYETHYIISSLKDGAKQTIQQLVEKQLAGE